MEAFFKKEKSPAGPGLTVGQLEALTGTWEARFASFYIGGAPVEVQGMPAFQLVIEKAAGGMRVRLLDGRSRPRALTIDGSWIRGAEVAGKPNLGLCIVGKELVGVLVGKAGKQLIHAEFKGVRQ
jgi:hypothetical protein